MSETASKNVLMAKARAFTISIQKMDAKQREAVPSGEYGEDYNKLRNFVAVHYPQLEGLLPPRVTFYGGASRSFTNQRYSEIDTFCEQIVQLLSSISD